MLKEKLSAPIIQKIIWFYLFLNPILDVITSFSIHFWGSSMPLVLGLKFFFLFFLFLLNILYFDKKSFWYSIVMLGYTLLFFLVLYFYQGTSGLFLNAQSFFRTFYFPFVLLFLFSLQRKQLFVVNKKYLSYLLFLYLLFLVVPELLHLGFSSYAHSKVGGLGWYYSTNEISGILAILGPFMLSFVKEKKGFFRILFLVFYFLGILVLGTKVPILAFCITIFCFLGSYFYFLYKNKRWKSIGIAFVSSLIGFVCFILVLFSSSFYQNIKIHLNFLEIYRVQDLFTFHHIDHFIFSERLSFLKSTHEVYEQVSLPEKVLGMGMVQKENSESMKMIEMDYFDIFYHYGIIGFLLFFSCFFLISWKRKYTLEEKVSIFLIFLLGFFSGHIFVAPSVSVISVLVFIPKEDEVMS